MELPKIGLYNDFIFGIAVFSHTLEEMILNLLDFPKLLLGSLWLSKEMG